MSFNIINTYKRLRLKLIILVSFFVFIIGLANIYYVFVYLPVSNDECIWREVPQKGNDTKQLLVFEKVKVDGVTWKAGIRNGDYLLAINDTPLVNSQQAQLIINKLKAGSYATYTIKRANVTCNVSIYIKKLVSFGIVAFDLLAFIWFCIGFIVIMAKSDGQVQRLFYKVGAAFVLAQGASILQYQITYSFSPNYQLIYLFFGLVCLASIVLLPFYFIKFFWVFPQRFKFITYKYFNRIFYSLPLVVGFLILYLSVNYTGKSASIRITNDVGIIINSSLISSVFIGFFSLIINYIRVKNKEERKPVFIILVTFILCVAALVYTNFIAPRLVDTMYNSPEYFTPIIIVVLLPIAFGYVIFKYQLMDVSIVIKNTIIYGTATVALAGLYFGFIYLLGQSVSMAISTEYRSIIGGFVFIVFAMVFQSTKDKLQDLITRQFYPEQFAFQRMLIKFSNEVSGVVGLSNILNSMQNTFVDSLKLKQFAILLKNENTKIFELRNCHGLETCFISVNYANSNLDTYLQQKSITINSVIIEQNDFSYVFPEESSLLIEQRIYTIVPLVIKSKVIGLLLFGLKYSGSQFAGKDIELLCSAANQSAIAIENARLYQLENEKVKIEFDLEYARKIQQGLLPRSVPAVHGLDICGEMIPAMQVGGDYFDLIKVSGNKLFVIVGDVSGKGLSAALYMAKLQTMLQLICSDTRTPKELLIELNKRLYDAMEKNWFITMSVALFDYDSHKISFCRAGHVPVILVNQTESKIFQPKGIGAGLEQGKIFDSSLVQLEYELKKDDVWIFVSDGVTEAMDEEKNLYGIDNLINLVNQNHTSDSTKIMYELITSLADFRGSAEQNDDITAVIVKINE